MDPIEMFIGGMGVTMLFVGFVGLALGSGNKGKVDSIEQFFERIQKGEYAASSDANSYRVPGSDFRLYIDQWSDDTYYCTVSNSDHGEIFELKYKQSSIYDFKNKSELINLENADIVKAYINTFLTNHVSEINERERNQTEINSKMKNDRKINVTPVKLDKVIIALLQETKDTIKYISTYTEELSVEEEHHFEQLRDTDIPTLLESYQRLDKEKQKSEKETLLEGLEVIKLELEDTKKRVQTRTTRQFEKRIEIAKQRKRDREIGEM